MSLPVPGGILAQLAPATGAMDPRMLMALAAMKGGAPDATPGAAIAPAAIDPATVAANASPAPVSVAAPPPAPLDHMAGPTMADVAAGLPQGDIPQHRGILGRIGDTLHDPTFRAQALRFGMGAFQGGVGGGLKAATDFTEQRRAAAEDARRFDAGQQLKERGLANDERNTDITGTHYDRSDANQRTGILSQYQLGHEGHQVDERNSIRSNTTSRVNNHEDNATSRANTGDTVRASILNNNTDNATTRDVASGRNTTDVTVATINSGQKGRLKPDDAMAGVGGVVAGLVGKPDDPDGVANALRGSPDLQAQLVDAYTTAWGDGEGNAAERAQKAVSAILGEGPSISNHQDGYFGTFGGHPGINRGQQAKEKQVVRTGTDKATGKKVVQYSDGSISYAD